MITLVGTVLGVTLREKKKTKLPALSCQAPESPGRAQNLGFGLDGQGLS